jgi:uncharacterized membrane protein HdeD (DUF308 family)
LDRDGIRRGAVISRHGAEVAQARARRKTMFANILSRYWWMTLLRGVIWVVFGLIVFVQPGISLVSLTLMFGAFAFVDGVAAIVTGFAGRHEHEQWWTLLLLGMCGIGIGILTFLSPGLTALALLFYIAAWAMITGVLEIITAIRLRKEITGEFWLALSGILSLAFGLFVVARPGAGALALLWLIAFYAIAFGVTLILLSFKVRGFVKHAAA